MLPRLVSRIALVILLPFSCAFLHGQTSPPTTTSAQQAKVDAQAFAILFRRTCLLEKMAQDADIAGKPAPHLHRLLPARFTLSDFDYQSLVTVSAAWSAEQTATRAKLKASLTEFHSRFPGHIAHANEDRSAPAEFASLQAALDLITLHHRDLLQNAMRSDDFASLLIEVEQTFAGALPGRTPLSSSAPLQEQK